MRCVDDTFRYFVDRVYFLLAVLFKMIKQSQLYLALVYSAGKNLASSMLWHRLGAAAQKAAAAEGLRG